MKRGESTQRVSSQSPNRSIANTQENHGTPWEPGDLGEPTPRFPHSQLGFTEGSPPSKPVTNLSVRHTLAATLYFHSLNSHTTEQLQLPLPMAHSPYSAHPTRGLLTPPSLLWESSSNRLNETLGKVQMTKASSETPHQHSTHQAWPYWVNWKQ